MATALIHNPVDEGQSIIVGPAVLRGSMFRTRIQQEGQGTLKTSDAGESDFDSLEWISHYILYPDLVGAVQKSEGFTHWPLSYEEFMQLDAAFVSEWEEWAYEANPKWRADVDRFFAELSHSLDEGSPKDTKSTSSSESAS